MGKLQRLHQRVQPVVSAGGDHDADLIAVVIRDRLEAEIAANAVDADIRSASGVPAGSSVSRGTGFHLQSGVAVKDLTAEGRDLLSVDLLQSLFNRVHRYPPL